MAENEVKVLKFIWKIENYSYCWNAQCDFLQSPDFEMDVFEGSSWCLKLYPRGIPPNVNHISIHLERLQSSSGPLVIPIDYEISLLRPDGTAEYVKEGNDRLFRKGFEFGFNQMAIREEILGIKKPIFLPEDILTVQCRILPKLTQLKSHTEIIAKTHLELERYIFQWKSENCFSERCDEFKTLTFFNGTQPLELKLYWLTVDELEYLYIHFSNMTDVKVFHCKLCILDSTNLISQCLLDKHIDVDEHSFRLIAVDEILKQKSTLLPDDKLTLYCDFTCSFRIQNRQIEVVAFDNNFSVVPGNRDASFEGDTAIKNDLCSSRDIYASFKKDFLALYQDETLCDFTLKVGNENIRVHRAVLVARSPVYKAMLTTNTKENEQNMEDISDLSAKVVRCMLTYMYTDVIGNDLNCGSAAKLYYAAIKYRITKLKRLCSDLFKRNLCVSNVGETLAIADIVGDEPLLDFALEFLCRHEQEVIGSPEWKLFMTVKTNLAAEVMHYIFMKKPECIGGKI